eukprot:m.163217 g.163217  ORF g.163217 m.163217 type:complete len:111 (-) comp14626_c0_seq5:785-1117(-)
MWDKEKLQTQRVQEGPKRHLGLKSRVNKSSTDRSHRCTTVRDQAFARAPDPAAGTGIARKVFLVTGVPKQAKDVRSRFSTALGIDATEWEESEAAAASREDPIPFNPHLL